MGRMERSQDDKHSYSITMCINATKSAPEYLSHRETNDDIDTTIFESGRIKRLCK